MHELLKAATARHQTQLTPAAGIAWSVKQVQTKLSPSDPDHLDRGQLRHGPELFHQLQGSLQRTTQL